MKTYIAIMLICEGLTRTDCEPLQNVEPLHDTVRDCIAYVDQQKPAARRAQMLATLEGHGPHSVFLECHPLATQTPA